MLDWMDTILALATGWMLGVVITRMHFQAQLKLCRQVISERLDAVSYSLTRPAFRVVPVRVPKTMDPR